MAKSTKFPLEKILAVTPTEYCESKGRTLRDYELVGITHQGALEVYSEDDNYTRKFSAMHGFIKKIPENAEVVVNFTQNYGKIAQHVVACGFGSQSMYVTRYCLIGTALIRRRK